MDFQQLFNDFSKIKVAVIGDVMLDTYWWGKVDRISPEAPVPVVAVTKREQRIGGAGNVALNLVSLGAHVNVLTVLGKDDDGEQLTTLFNQNNIGAKYIVTSTDRITTNKIRIISRNQHMMRLDAEMQTDITQNDEEKLLYAFEEYIAAESPDIVILEDYNKGVLTQTVVTKIIALCKQHHILTAVDPKRKNFFSYVGVDIFKPNLKEAVEGLNILTDVVSLSLLKDIHLLLQEKLKHKISFITLSEKGVFYNDNNSSSLIPTHIRSIADVSGAGDTFTASFTFKYLQTKNVEESIIFANKMSSIVVSKRGVATP